MSGKEPTVVWLVVRYNDRNRVGDSEPGGSPLYQRAGGWTPDPNAALRYARREDAQAVAEWDNASWPFGRGAVAEEHAFVPLLPSHYPPGMGEESRRLHREYNLLVEEQRNGARNGAEVIRVTDECNAKGIILVPGGENL